MTGFGAAARHVAGIAYALEIRSVNHRAFHASLRVPEPLLALETELDRLLRRRLERGAVTLVLTLRDRSGTPQVNDTALLAYLEHLGNLSHHLPESVPAHIDLAALMNLPGVLEAPAAQHGALDPIRAVVNELTEEACEQLLAMRRAEGEALAADLELHLGRIREHHRRIGEQAPDVVERYRQRLRQRLRDLLGEAGLDQAEPELLREVTLFAEKCDIAEELQRLGGHLDQFAASLEGQASRPVGRTLEFIAQEMLREANTIASKAGEPGISRSVVEIKGAIDRIKEQAANVV